MKTETRTLAMEMLIKMETAGERKSELNKFRLREGTSLNGLRDFPEFNALKDCVNGT